MLKPNSARRILWTKLAQEVPYCHGCDKRVYWDPKPRELKLVTRVLDGDPSNLDPDNIVASCYSCLRRATTGNAIGPDEIVYVNRNGRRSRGVEKTCEACEATFVIEAANARADARVGRFCSGSCRSRTVNLIRSGKIQARVA